MPLVNELARIEADLLPKNKKWGWIIYRTTYGDDEKWKRFNEMFQK
jgi:hypothetical protein